MNFNIKKYQLILISIFSGLLMAAAWPDYGWSWIIFISWVPMLFVEDYIFQNKTFFSPLFLSGIFSMEYHNHLVGKQLNYDWRSCSLCLKFAFYGAYFWALSSYSKKSFSSRQRIFCAHSIVV